MDTMLGRLEGYRDEAHRKGDNELGDFLEALRERFVSMRAHLHMVEEPETAPCSEWVAARAKEFLA